MTDKPDIQDFELIAPIAEGGFGEVWLARNVLGCFRAIKVVKWSESSKEDHEKKLKHFQAEFKGIKAYAPISQKHDGLLDILHTGIREAEGYYFYVLPLADDLRLGSDVDPENYTPKTLAKYLQKSAEGRLTPEESIEIIRQVAFALRDLHGEGVVHRDIKPDNIICVNDRWCLGDIGLVAKQGAETFVGTLGFLAPEGPGKPAADIFSLGKVLYEISTGKTPDSFPDYPTWAFANCAEQDRFKQINESFCKACAPVPKDRYQDASEFIASLEVNLSPEPAQPNKPKDYIYVSRTKVNVMADQLPLEDVSTGSDNRALYHNLSAVIDYLDSRGLIGEVDSPKDYFRGSMLLRWAPLPGHEETMVYFGGRTNETVLGLGGSMKHMVGIAESFSAVPHDFDALCSDSFLFIIAGALMRREDYPHPQLWDAVDFATGNMEGPHEKIEFVAKKLWAHDHRGQKVLLGTPFYAARVGSG